MYGERFELKEKNGICRAKKDMKSEMRDMHFDSLGRRERERDAIRVSERMERLGETGDL